MRYTPFEKRVEDLTGADLAVLRDVAEGWYVEYKSAPIATKSIAKSLSAFANHYGGWLFFGIGEKSGVADSFCGFDEALIEELLKSLRNASATCLNPHVYYEHKVLYGPVEEIGLPVGAAIVAVRIPAGANPPYVHNDGRIYRRIGDASSPKPETDRAVLDQLWKRGRNSRRAVKRLVTRIPDVAEEPSKAPCLHIYVGSDPFGVSGRTYHKNFEWFRTSMRCDPIPFDNFFSFGSGFIARQTAGNDHRNRMFTWEFSMIGHSRITFPISAYTTDILHNFQTYTYFARFFRQIEACKMLEHPPTILDLNFLFALLHAIFRRHRALMSDFRDFGPFFAKSYIQNTRRCVPYIDSGRFVDFVERNGIPMIQDGEQVAPPGWSLESFVEMKKSDTQNEEEQSLSDAITALSWIIASLGVPMDILREISGDLIGLLDRAQAAQTHRNRSQ